ncbi:DnaD domain-containing protein [Granulicatella sp. 20925_1_45]|jgi:DNA replication protein dnaD (primosomal protein dnaD)|uniref:DnaD domain-containing protein n=1 Tax=Granulicatella sp. 20925_1_45 TaxID=3003685 RepID=UPI00352CA12D
MALTFQEHWIYSGSTSVPNALLQNYRKLQLTADECLLIAWLMQRHPEESFVIDVRATCIQFGIDERQLFSIIQHLMDRQVLEIKQREAKDGKKVDYYSFKPLLRQLEVLFKQSSFSVEKMSQKDVNVLALIEQEFNRQLSGFEIEMISGWIHKDKYPQELIVAALKEAILNQAHNVKYIDRILLAWKNKGIKSAQQLAASETRTKNAQVEVKPNETANQSVPLVNWVKR